MERTYWVYILASRRNGTLYVGITGQLEQRIHLHRIGRASAFTRKYGVRRLVHVESFSDVSEAIAREKAIKKWRRAWKLQLIERDNPTWSDLAAEWCDRASVDIAAVIPAKAGTQISALTGFPLSRE